MVLIFKAKKGVSTGSRTKRITISEFGGINSVTEEILSSPKYCVEGYNYDIDSGALVSGHGVGFASFADDVFFYPQGVRPVKCYFYPISDLVTGARKDRIITYASNQKVYYHNVSMGGLATEITGMTFTSIPIGVQYRYENEDVFILSTPEDGLVVLKENGFVSVSNAPQITSMTFHFERLFVTTANERSTVWFSDDFDPTNWSVSIDEAGFIDMPDERGSMLKAVSFLDYLYVFREYGISRITAYGDQNEFTATNLFNDRGKIYAGSITTCGDYILYLTDCGFYRFNGVDSTPILYELKGLFDGVQNDNCEGVYHKGKYYLLCNAKFDGFIKRVLLIYDVTTKYYYFMQDFAIRSISTCHGVKDELLILDGCIDVIGAINDECSEFGSDKCSVWQGARQDFGLAGRRGCITSFSAYTEGEVKFEIFSDEGSWTAYVNGDGQKRIKPLIAGRWFALRIESFGGGNKICKPTIEVTYV